MRLDSGKRSAGVVILTLAALFGALSCGNKSEPQKNPVAPPGGTPAPTTKFTGYFGDGHGHSGPIVITIAAASLAPAGPRLAGASRAPANLISATAQIDLGLSTTLRFSGWYDSGDRSLALTGDVYTFFGRLDTLSGIPAFVAVDSSHGIPYPWWWGSFVAVPDSSGTIPVHCGLGSPRRDRLGVMGFARVDTTLLGIAWVNLTFEWFLLQGRLVGSGNARTVEMGGSEPGGDSLSVEGTFYMGTGTGGGTYRILRDPPGVSEFDVWDIQPCN